MKHHIIKKLAGLFTVCVILSACDEKTQETYHAPDGIYFNNLSSSQVLTDTTTLSFVYQPDGTEYLDIPVKIQTIGFQSDEDRPINIKAYSDNAVEGVDYSLITPPIIPANTSSIDYTVRLIKTDALLTEIKSVTLELGSNDYFSTFLPDVSTGDNNHPIASRFTYRIDFSNFYSTPPAGWLEEYVGVFSERKLRLIWKLFDSIIPREKFNEKGAIPFNQWVYMKNELDIYMTEQLYIMLGLISREVDSDALVDPDAQGDDRELLDFTPITSEY